MPLACRRPAPRSAHGFTLIEVMVVLIIITLFSSLTVLSLEGVRSHSVDSEIERLRTVLETASDYANVHGTPIAVDFLADGYRFSALNTDGTWHMLFKPASLAQQTWPASVSVESLEVDKVAMKPPLRLVFAQEAPNFKLVLRTASGIQVLTGSLLGTVTRSVQSATQG